MALRGVGLVIDETTILRAIDWNVAAHERWVIVGANGAGKTSLLRIASLHAHPSHGSVRCLGEELGRCDLRALRSRTAFSSPAMTERLEPTMNALEVVMTALTGALAPWWHRYDDADRTRSRAMLERFGVARFEQRTLASLSAGERQKVLFARAMVRDPELVFLDEPTSGLDIGAREQILADLTSLAVDANASPMVVVTHHLEEIPNGFTHALVLRDGTAIAQGPIEATLTSETLSECYGVDLTVTTHGGRFGARLRER